MGQTISYGLTQAEVDEMVEHCQGAFTQKEIESLYKRFRSLDKGRKGFITAEEFLSIPELSINPLAQRLSFFFESINFRDFVAMLAPYSAKASRAHKLRHIFAVLDVDGDGAVSDEDLELVLRQLGGAALSDAERRALVGRVMREAGAPPGGGLDYARFAAAMAGAEVERTLCVDVPAED